MSALSTPRHNPPWLFGFLAAPGGIAYWGMSALLIPYLLRKHGVPVDRIAEVAAVSSIPNVWSFVVAPVVDLGLPRRIWVLSGTGIYALLAWAAVAFSSGSLFGLTVLLFAGATASSLASSAAGGLMTNVHPSVRGRAAGFAQTGNIGVGAMSGGLLIWLADHVSLPSLAVLTALLIFLPALAALWIDEAPRTRATLLQTFAGLFSDLKELLCSKRTWLGLVFFLSPVGAGALGNLISGVGPDYHASGDVVAWVTGAGGGVLMALGAFLGGWICDRVHRMTAYAVFGLLGSMSALWLWLGPATPFTYAAGYSAYALSSGLAYTAYYALILEVVGMGSRSASTGVALMGSSGNVPLIYMTSLDGVGYRSGGARGLMATDALVSGAGGLILLVVARHFAKRWAHAGRSATRIGGE